jgi:hypothetical protein
MPVTSLPPAQDTELSLSVERAYRESLVTDRLGAIWSLILAKCFLAQWAILRFEIPSSGTRYIWTPTLIMGIVASAYYLHAHRVRLYLLPTHFRVNAAVLAGLLVSLGFVGYAFFARGLLSASLAAALAAVLLGSWSLARAALRRAWPPLFGAFLWWGLAATALRSPADQALLWLGLGLLCAQALPGFAVAAQASRRRA